MYETLTALDGSNSKVAAKLTEVAQLIAMIETKLQPGPRHALQSKEEPPVRESTKFIDPVIGQWCGIPPGGPTTTSSRPE